MLKLIFLITILAFSQIHTQIANFSFDLDDLEVDESFIAERADRKAFEQFKKTYEKNYLGDSENELKFKVFRNNLRKIDALNALDQGTAFYKINQFADLTTKEFISLYTGLKINKEDYESFNYVNTKINKTFELPKEFDWREKGAVTEVKDQGMCGSCYAFSAIGNIEGINKVVNGELISLSEEEIIDCDTLSFGCNGGYMINAFQSIIKLGGVESEKNYPYNPFKQHSCNFNKNLSAVKISSYVNLIKDEVEIAKYLVLNGPVSIGINANAMQFYFRGISHPYKFLCNQNTLNHGVLLVGFGEITRRGKPYPFWIIKNSWSKKWGRSGYYYLYRGENSCGVAEMASSAIIEKTKLQV